MILMGCLNLWLDQLRKEHKMTFYHLSPGGRKVLTETCGIFGNSHHFGHVKSCCVWVNMGEKTDNNKSCFFNYCSQTAVLQSNIL